MDDAVWVWGENGNPEPPGAPPGVGFGLWPYLFGQEWLRFPAQGNVTWYLGQPHPGSMPSEWDQIRRAKVAIVNLFHTDTSTHIQAIKQMHPSCFVIACPDSSLDQVLNHPEWLELHRQMSLADAIGGRTQEDCRVYGTLLDKRTFYLPCPIGPTEFFLPYRDLPKDDYILSLDHHFAPPNSYTNVAALATIQRRTGARILYACERDWTRDYARFAGLKTEFLGEVPQTQFIEITARAVLSIDMYPSHSVGRHQMVCAAVGTPCISNNFSTPVVGAAILADMYNPHDVYAETETYLHDAAKYQANRAAGFRYIEKRCGFEASRQRLADILEKIEVKP